MNEEKGLTISERVATITNALDKRQDEFAAALGVAPERFLRIVHTAIAGNADLAMCDPASIIGAALEAAQCGLNVDPVLREGSLVPFKGKARFLPGYAGVVKLAIESGFVRLVDAEVVHAQDVFRYTKGTDERLEHVPYLGDEDPGKVVAAYAKVIMQSGDIRFVVLPRRHLENVRKRAPGSGSEYSPWNTDTEEMFKKTVVHNAMKLIPKSPKAEQALAAMVRFDESRDPPAEKDITPTPAEKRRAGKRKEKDDPTPAEPEKKTSTVVADARKGPSRANGGDDDPPPPDDSHAPANVKPAQTQAPSGQGSGGSDRAPSSLLISDEQRAKLQKVVIGQDTDPKGVIEGIVGHPLPRLSDLTVDEYAKVLQALAPEEVDSGGGFFD